MATANTFPIGREITRDEPVNILKAAPKHNATNLTTGDGEPMTKAEMAEIADLRDTVHNISASVMLLTKLQQAQSAPMTGNGKWTGWIQTGVICGMLLVSGTNAFKSSESDLRRDIAVLSEKVSQSEERQKDRERNETRERALLDERYRQMSIALESRGVKLPKQ